ncbi:MAG: DUF2264 domain-containing protein [Proteobacteria bacterium]|nr:DUF2264 domain-containing protein [Pseudomonadota bacterium]MBI3498182.1 DUF2264 domain-containing protein [Pseudomonadota bacterium]
MSRDLGFRPLSGNPFRSRADVAAAVEALFQPLRSCFSPGRARVRVATSAARFDEAAAELEGFSRPLWGLVPLAVGGGTSDAWELVCQGLASGSDPSHPEFWGWTEERDQRMVEMAAIGFALALVPELVWEPLPSRVRDNLLRWLSGINEHETVDNNWRFFRVLVNLGLQRVGGPWRRDLVADALAKLDRFYLGDGWYRDGERCQLDYYVAFAFHFYGLIYARLAQEWDQERSATYRERARLFARDFRHWFGRDGAAIPFGRSLTYRFAQGAFWGALAFADVEALPWGEVKGLYLRHLRWWSDKPIADRNGALTIGYSYANLLISEEYNSPQSPYWAMKAFLPLAVAGEHPFWRAEETSSMLPSLSVQKHAGLVLQEDETHAVMLSSGQTNRLARQGTAKYAKFAYSSRFGFSVESGWGGIDHGCYDSMLAVALADVPDQYRVREIAEETAQSGGWLYSRWKPWAEVEVETWLVPVDLPWLLRIHRLRSERAILTKEGGFAADRTGSTHADREFLSPTEVQEIRIDAAGGILGIRDLALAGRAPGRLAATARPLPNTNLISSRTIMPMLLGRHASGRHLMATAVFATHGKDTADRLWPKPPVVPQGPWFDD